MASLKEAGQGLVEFLVVLLFVGIIFYIMISYLAPERLQEITNNLLRLINR